MTDFPRFQLVWLEHPVDPGRHVGALLGATHMVAAIRERLLEAVRHDNLEGAIELAHILVESFYQRLYFLRERAVRAVGALTQVEHKEFVNKKKSTRNAAYALAERTAPRSSELLRALLTTTWPDVELRNRHTHHQFVDLEFSTGHDGWDPIGVLTEVAGTGNEAATHEAMREALVALAAEYDQRVQAVIDIAFALAEALDTEKLPRPTAD